MEKKIILSKENITLSIFCIYIFFRVFGKSTVVEISNFINNGIDIITIILVLSLFFMLLSYRYTLKTFMWISSITIFLIINFYLTKNHTLLISFITIVSLKNIELDLILKSIFKALSIGLLVVIILSFIGIIDPGIIYRGELLRNSLGFTHPNTTGQIIFVIMSLFLYLYYDKLNALKLFLLIALSIVFLKVTDSRTAFYLLYIEVAIILFYKLTSNNKVINYIIYLITIWLPYFLILISFFSAKFFNKSSFLQSIDIVFSGRIKYSNLFLNKYGISYLGKEIVQVGFGQSRGNMGVEAMMLDSGYMRLIIEFGLLATLLFIVTYTYAIKNIYNMRNIKMLIVIQIFLIYGLSESIILNSFTNFTLFSIIFLFDGKKNQSLEGRKDDFYNNSSS